MRRLAPPFARSLLGLALALLVLPVVGSAQTTWAQEPPTFDVDKPIVSLRRATPSSDSQLVALATTLMEARADTKISYSTYEKGVWYFLENHPGFYGNFFGDPFYATYDIRYFKLVRMRQLAELEINPLNGFNIGTSFFCDPLSYDPAFGGVCRGFRYAVSDFLRGPLSIRKSAAARGFASTGLLATRGFASTHFLSVRHFRDDFAERNDPDEDSRRIPDSLRQAPDFPAPERTERSAHGSTATVEGKKEAVAFSPTKPILGLDQPLRRLHLPDDVNTSMQETASSLKRTEKILRFRRRIERRYGNHLSAWERAEAAERYAEELPLGGPLEGLEGLSQIRGLSDLHDGGAAGPSSEFDPPELSTVERSGSHEIVGTETGASFPTYSVPETSASDAGSSNTHSSNSEPSGGVEPRPEEPEGSGES